MQKKKMHKYMADVFCNNPHESVVCAVILQGIQDFNTCAKFIRKHKAAEKARQKMEQETGETIPQKRYYSSSLIGTFSFSEIVRYANRALYEISLILSDDTFSFIKKSLYEEYADIEEYLK